MTEKQRKYQNLVLQGWVGMLFLLLTMFITDIVQVSIQSDFEGLSNFLAADPGIKGLWFLAFLICINVLTQMSIRAINKSKCIWSVACLTALYTLFFFGHQVEHLLSAQSIDVHFIINITHHILGVWATVCAYKWAVSMSNNMNHGACA